MPNLEACQFGTWPYAAKQSCGAFQNLPEIAYLQAVLKCKVGDTDWDAAHPITTVYDGRTFNGVLAVQRWYNAAGWNLPEDGYCSQTMWSIFDHLAAKI